MLWRNVSRMPPALNEPCWLMRCVLWTMALTVPYTPWWKISMPITWYRKWSMWQSQPRGRLWCTRWVDGLDLPILFCWNTASAEIMKRHFLEVLPKDPKDATTPSQLSWSGQQKLSKLSLCFCYRVASWMMFWHSLSLLKYKQCLN